MKLLLDTHIWIHALGRPERLSDSVRRAIRSPQNELFLSPISVWEAHHLHLSGKLKAQPSFSVWLPRAFDKLPVQEAPLTFAIAVEEAGVNLPQADLGDQFLAATASVLGLTLVTSDSQLLACTWLKTLANE